MSGIAGIYHMDGRPVDMGLLARMTDTMAHRGPDAAGRWIDGSVGLGHRMLYATPESVREQQPLADETGNLCLVLDGRVDNREELRAALVAKGTNPRTDTDAELVLCAYQCWGEDCPAKIIGDFAFAIWDARKRQLFCARDPLGMKSLYYHSDGRTFVCASEMQPLFEEPTLRRTPNLLLIGMYLSENYDEREETLYEGVYRLPPAHSLVVKDGSVRKARYWDADPDHAIRYRTDAEYAEHFLALFREAVRCRLRSHGPVGSCLSGGLDSSSIVCVAQALYDEQPGPGNALETFSVVFDRLPCDERPYIEEVIRSQRIKANLFPCERYTELIGIDQTARYPDVLYAPTLFMLAPAFQSMQQRGIKVLLDGIGGDELLAVGFAHLTDMLRHGHFYRLTQQLRNDADIYEVGRWPLFLNYCVRPCIPEPLKAVLRPLLRPWRREQNHSPVKPEFLKKSGLEQRLKAAVMVPKFPTCSQQAIYNGLFFGWNATVAAEISSLFAARFSVEWRRPFLDRRVVEYLLAVPEAQRWRADQPKLVLRHAMKGILPEAIRQRKRKTNYCPLYDHEMRVLQADQIEKLLRTSVLEGLGVIDTDQLLRLFEQYRNGCQDHSMSVIESIVALELWCRCAMGTSTDKTYQEDRAWTTNQPRATKTHSPHAGHTRGRNSLNTAPSRC